MVLNYNIYKISENKNIFRIFSKNVFLFAWKLFQVLETTWLVIISRNLYLNILQGGFSYSSSNIGHQNRNKLKINWE